jgi:2'-5' RNA ligase
MRCFLALDLPDDVTGTLDRLAARLSIGRHVPPEDMHLTLAFFEDAPLDALDELHLSLEMMAPPAMTLTVKGTDIFGSQQPRSLHVCVDGGTVLPAFQGKIAGHARAAGLTLPHRRFVPHITLARFANRLPPEDTARIGRFLAAHGDFALPAFVPSWVTLYRSTLGRDGPRYDILERYPFFPHSAVDGR